MKTDLGRGYTAALGSALILATTAIFIRYLTVEYGMRPLVLAMWRDGLVALTLVVVLGARGRRLMRVQRGALGPLVGYGLVLALFNAVWTLSVALNGAAVATVLAYSSPAFTVALGWWFLKESLSWGKLVAVALCMVGCVLVAGMLDGASWQVNGLGIVTGILSGLAYAVYSLMGRTMAGRGLNAWTTLLYTFASATVFLLAFNLMGASFLPGAARNGAELMWQGAPLLGWALLVALAAGPTVLGFGLYNVSLGLLPSSVANLIVTLEPAFTAAIAYVLLGERFTAAQVAGGLLIVVGVLFLRLYLWRWGEAEQVEVLLPVE